MNFKQNRKRNFPNSEKPQYYLKEAHPEESQFTFGGGVVVGAYMSPPFEGASSRRPFCTS